MPTIVTGEIPTLSAIEQSWPVQIAEHPVIGLIFKIVILGLLVWAVRGYVLERTKQRRAGDQLVTVDELKERCSKKAEEIREQAMNELSHVQEMIKKDLESGKARFDTQSEQIGELAREVRRVSDGVIRLATVMERNGYVKKG